MGEQNGKSERRRHWVCNRCWLSSHYHLNEWEKAQRQLSRESIANLA